MTEFLDVVMHSRETALLLEEVVLTTGSALHDQSLSAARVRDRTGALVLAVHDPAKGLLSNPASDVLLQAGQTLIAVGTPAQLAKLEQLAGGRDALGTGPDGADEARRHPRRAAPTR